MEKLFSNSVIQPIKNKQIQKLNLVQTYRGIAALLVVLTHANMIFEREINQKFLLGIFDFGWAGVDFFFVLSGFIIFYINQSDIGRASKFKEFILKRFVRIYPLYWTILTCKIIASLFFAYGGNTQPDLGDIIKAITLFPQENKELLNTKFLGVSWTLSYELFFYLVFSLLILVKTRFLAPVIIVWMFGSFLNLIGAIGFVKENFLLGFIFDAHNLEFAFGALAAYCIAKNGIKYPKFINFVSLFVLSLVSIGYNHKAIEISSVISYGIPFTLLLISSVTIEKRQSLKIPNIFIQLGDISYSVYLMHGFLIANLCKIISKANLAVFIQNPILFNIVGVIIVMIAVYAGGATYYYLEKPLLNFLRINLVEKMVKKAV